MNTLQQVLLVTVAFATLILLIHAILMAILTITILKRIRVVVDRARDSAEQVADIVEEVKSQMANPSTIASFITRIINKKRGK